MLGLVELWLSWGFDKIKNQLVDGTDYKKEVAKKRNIIGKSLKISKP